MKGQMLANDFECEKCMKDRTSPTIALRTITVENDMNPGVGSISLLLPKLNDIEEMFIAHVYVVQKIFRLSKGVTGYKGNIINMEQNLPSVITKLPLILSDLPIFICRKSNQTSPVGYKDFEINRDKILK